ncbi:MAG: radical SAM protein [Deltaproteobacteria bacterium]|nr:radical SAM protein [Deltaproteobacteria bacterium]
MTGKPSREVFADSRKVSRFLAKSDPLDILAIELGPRFLEYRRRWDLAKSFKEIPPFPLHVDYELRRACDLKCPMCLMGEVGPSAAELSPLLAESLIEEGAAAGQMAMGFGGLWEPLTSPHIPRLVAFGRSKGLLDAMVNTSGLRLSPSLSSDLIDSGLTRLMISLDAATKETYALMRPGSDFDKVVENIEALLAARKKKKRRLPLVRLSFCLTSLNEKELAPFIERWEGKADFISVQSYGHFGSGARPLFPKTSSLPAPSGRCAQPFKRLMVLHDRTVLPCCDLSGLSLKIGSVPESELSSLWHGPEIKELRSKLILGGQALPPACAKCQGKYRPAET